MGEIGGARIPLNSTEVARAKGVEPSRVGLKARCSAVELRPHHPVSCLCVLDVRFTPHLISCARRGRTFSHTGSLAPPGHGLPVRLAVPGVRTAPGPHDRLSSPVKVPQGAHRPCIVLAWRPLSPAVEMARLERAISCSQSRRVCQTTLHLDRAIP